ncbi:hypothetical protein [Mycobacterium kansasii]|uniref:hypothetical protein n=1 Tax=Mycobacterium kansasii TaxID=1768 RepID=UPI00055A9CF0|nr:hypothetical protein [Mycobacterium kansasii]
MAEPLRLRVGEHYDSGVRRWPGQELVLTTGGCVLLVEYVSVTPARLSEFQAADAHFAWVDARYNGILCFRFGAAPWTMIPFNPHRDTPPQRVPGLPEVARGGHLAVAVGLAESESPVLAVRVVEWPHGFVSAVAATVARLAAQPFQSRETVDESNFLFVFVGPEELAQRANVWSLSS